MTQTQLQEHLHSLEEQLLHPDRAPDRSALKSLLAPEFKEFCSSGRIINFDQVVDYIETTAARAATMSHFWVNPLGDDSALATYHITTATSTSFHSSLWVRRGNEWKMLFHQGTVAA